MENTATREEIAQILVFWDRLSDAEKECLIPRLLDRTRAWHSWSIEDATTIDWLERSFAKAGIEFRAV